MSTVENMAAHFKRINDAKRNEHELYLNHGENHPATQRADKKISELTDNLYKEHGKHLPPKKDFHYYNTDNHHEAAHYWHPDGKNHHKKLKDDKKAERDSDRKVLGFKEFKKKHGMTKTQAK